MFVDPVAHLIASRLLAALRRRPEEMLNTKTRPQQHLAGNATTSKNTTWGILLSLAAQGVAEPLNNKTNVYDCVCLVRCVMFCCFTNTLNLGTRRTYFKQRSVT